MWWETVKHGSERREGEIPSTYSTVEFSCLFCNTKISEFFDMAKSLATFLLLWYLKSLSYNSVAELRLTICHAVQTHTFHLVAPMAVLTNLQIGTEHKKWDWVWF